MDWFLYDRDLRHERVKWVNLVPLTLALKTNQRAAFLFACLTQLYYLICYIILYLISYVYIYIYLISYMLYYLILLAFLVLLHFS